MAKQLIPEELNQLIKECLTDGILTDEDRQEILKKAVDMGLDYDEIDLYLDAQVQKISSATKSEKGSTCPFCGSNIPFLSDKCPECGNLITPEATKEFMEIIDYLEDALESMKSMINYKQNKERIERYALKAEKYARNNPRVKQFLIEIDTEMHLAEERIKKEKYKQILMPILKFINLWIWPILMIYIGNLLDRSEVFYIQVVGGWMKLLGQIFLIYSAYKCYKFVKNFYLVISGKE